MTVALEKVITKKQTRDFIQFPYNLYRNDKNWVPQLLMDDYRKINRRKNPFYQHAEAEFFLARRDGVVVGRIAAIHDTIWEKTHQEKAAYATMVRAVQLQPSNPQSWYDLAYFDFTSLDDVGAALQALRPALYLDRTGPLIEALYLELLPATQS